MLSLRANPKPELTAVAFRRWPNGDIIAIMPEIPGTSPYDCRMYEHVGQHSAGDISLVMQRTRAAKPVEYAELLHELEQIGYQVRVIARPNQARYFEMRRAQCYR